MHVWVFIPNLQILEDVTRRFPVSVVTRHTMSCEWVSSVSAVTDGLVAAGQPVPHVVLGFPTDPSDEWG